MASCTSCMFYCKCIWQQHISLIVHKPWRQKHLQCSIGSFAEEREQYRLFSSNISWKSTVRTCEIEINYISQSNNILVIKGSHSSPSCFLTFSLDFVEIVTCLLWKGLKNQDIMTTLNQIPVMYLLAFPYHTDGLNGWTDGACEWFPPGPDSCLWRFSGEQAADAA